MTLALAEHGTDGRGLSTLATRGPGRTENSFAGATRAVERPQPRPEAPLDPAVHAGPRRLVGARRRCRLARPDRAGGRRRGTPGCLYGPLRRTEQATLRPS